MKAEIRRCHRVTCPHCRTTAGLSAGEKERILGCRQLALYVFDRAEAGALEQGGVHVRIRPRIDDPRCD